MHAPRLPASLLGFAALFAACGGDDAAQQAAEANKFTVRRDDLPITVRENAELQALRETIVRSDVEGQSTIIYIVPEGTVVKQGERLVELDVSELVEKRANQAISVAKADAALTQAKKEKEILEKELSTKRNTASSNLRIAEMELEKLLGRKSRSGSEGKNADMIQRLQGLVSMPAPSNPTAGAEGNPAMDAAGGEAGATTTETTVPAAAAVKTIDPRSYGGLVDKVYELLAIDGDNTAAAERDMGDMANKILQQADTIRLAMADLKIKEDTYGHSRRLAKKQWITRNELEKDQLAYQSQMSKVSLAWNDLDLLINYTLARERIKLTQDRDNAALELERVKGSNEAAVIKADSDLQSRVAEFELAKERLDNLDRQIKSAVVYAPTPGTVVYARIDRNRGGGEAVREGVQVRERQELIILPDTTKMRSVIKVQEAQVDKVVRGQPAFVTIEAFQGENFTGRVTSVAPVADSNSGWMTSDRKVYTTVVELDSDNPDGRLRSRMAANVTIMVDTVKNTLPVPLQAVERDRAVNYVWRAGKDRPEAVPIRVGRQNSERVEVLEGLTVGDVIYLKPPIGVQAPKFEQPVAPTPAPLPADGTPKPQAVPQSGSPGPTAGSADGGDRPRRPPGGGAGARKKFADMTAEELEQAKSRLEGMPAMVDRFREQLGEEGAKDMEATIDLLRKALAANDLAAAQAQQDKLSTAMRSMMGGGRRNAGAGGPGGGGDGGSRADRGN
jgi:HlyD family secretion protein